MSRAESVRTSKAVGGESSAAQLCRGSRQAVIRSKSTEPMKSKGGVVRDNRLIRLKLIRLKLIRLKLIRLNVLIRLKAD